LQAAEAAEKDHDIQPALLLLLLLLLVVPPDAGPLSEHSGSGWACTVWMRAAMASPGWPRGW
jgi:hypothetical protein